MSAETLLGLNEVAMRLDVHPFEAIRLSVMATEHVMAFPMREDQADALAAAAGLERWWRTEQDLPLDNNPKRRAVRACLDALIQHGATGGTYCRMDNLFRGLGPALQEELRGAVSELIRLGYLGTEIDHLGQRVTLMAEWVQPAKDIVARGQGSDGLKTYWGDGESA